VNYAVCAGAPHASTDHCSQTAYMDFFAALGTAQLREIGDLVSDSPFIKLTTDETTDIKRNEVLCVLLSGVHPDTGQPWLRVLGMPFIEGQDAATITSALLRTLMNEGSLTAQQVADKLVRFFNILRCHARC
jgi:hypothetical protein